jgi:hypothetical protein
MSTIIHDAPALGFHAPRTPAALAHRLKERLRDNLSRKFGHALHTLARDLFDPYRPEQHYMRGPGPKWHAKND